MLTFNYDHNFHVHFNPGLSGGIVLGWINDDGSRWMSYPTTKQNILALVKSGERVAQFSDAIVTNGESTLMVYPVIVLKSFIAHHYISPALFRIYGHDSPLWDTQGCMKIDAAMGFLSEVEQLDRV